MSEPLPGSAFFSVGRALLRDAERRGHGDVLSARSCGGGSRKN